MLGLLVAGIAVLLLAGWFAVTSFIWPIRETDTGTCALWDPDNCSDLTLSHLEEIAQLDLPANSDILDSGSSKSFLSGGEWGVVRLPDTAAPPLVLPLTPNTSADQLSKRLRDSGFSTVTGSKSSSEGRYYTEVIVGADSSGRTLILIERRWNG
jgi:hypothetical protein